MIKPILIQSNSTGDIGRYVDSNNLILRSKNDLPRGENVEIILIDTKAEIVEGDKFLTKNGEIFTAIKVDAIQCFYSDLASITKKFCNKIISSTNKSHTVDLGHLCLDVMPQLSNNSKLLLIDYYNKHGEMPKSVDVEMKYIYPIESGIPNTSREPDLEIKLNQQGEVDITIPEDKLQEDFLDAANELFESKIVPKIEETYTEEEVEQLFSEYENYCITYYDGCQVDPVNWLNYNKK